MRRKTATAITTTIPYITPVRVRIWSFGLVVFFMGQVKISGQLEYSGRIRLLAPRDAAIRGSLSGVSRSCQAGLVFSYSSLLSYLVNYLFLWDFIPLIHSLLFCKVAREVPPAPVPAPSRDLISRSGGSRFQGQLTQKATPPSDPLPPAPGLLYHVQPARH